MRVHNGAISTNKGDFLRLGVSLLKKVRNHLGVQGEVRSCKGGPAVCGEVILHTAAVYVCFCVPSFGGGLHFYYRRCQGRNDYSGEANRWYPFDLLAQDPMKFILTLEGLLAARN
jgi:hypothetical protein